MVDSFIEEIYKNVVADNMEFENDCELQDSFLAYVEDHEEE